jgi:phosphate transport system substrate-binding protein
MLVDCDDPPHQWTVGESRHVWLIAQNVGDEPFQVPSDPHTLFSWGVGSPITENPKSELGPNIQPRRLGGGGTPFLEVAPKASFGIALPLSPIAPGRFQFDAVVTNRCKEGTERRFLKAPGGESVSTLVPVAILNPWLGSVALTHSFEIVAAPPNGWADSRKRLDRLLSDPRVSEEQQLVAFRELVAKNDWWSWILCCEALDRPKWRIAHDMARERLAAMLPFGFPCSEWHEFVSRIDSNPRWARLRLPAIPLVKSVAEGYVRVTKPGAIVFDPSVATSKEARELLQKWADESSGEVAAMARAALDEVGPVPADSMDRGFAGRPPGPALPSPVAMPTGKIEGTVKVSVYWSMYYLAAHVVKELAKAAPGVAVEIHGRDKENDWDLFDRGEKDIYVLAHDPRFLESLLHKRYPDPAPWPSTSWLGDSVACIVVHPRNPIAELDTTTLQRIFFATNAPGWDIAGGRAVAINRYVEDGGRTGEIVRDVIGGGSSYDNNKTHHCKSPADLLERVGADPNAIGFMRFASDVIKAEKKVRIVAVRRVGGLEKAVVPSMETISDGTYPLCERLTLLAKPNASPATQAFLSAASQVDWNVVGDDSGFWPTSEIRKWRTEKRLELLKSGKAAKVTALGPRAGKAMLDSICLEMTRDEIPVQGSYAALAEDQAIRRFMAAECDLLITSGPLTPESLAEYDTILPTFGLRSVPLERESLAIVVHPAHALESLSLEQLRGVLSGTTREWWASPPGGAGIKRYGPPAVDESLAWLAARLGLPERSLKLEHRRTPADIIKAVASDPQGIGVVNMAGIPAETSGLTIVPVSIPGDRVDEAKLVRSADEGYPFAREWFLHTHQSASPLARLLAERLAEGKLAGADAERRRGTE